MKDDILNFYDDLSGDYHLIFEDWDVSVKRQGVLLDSLIRSRLKGVRHPAKLLDCSCGIGTQSIGLSLLGYRVHATDLSPCVIKRAEQEAKRLGAELTFGVADMRNLRLAWRGTYDLVISFDNSLPHLLTDEDLFQALGEIYAMLAPGGWFLASIRDYDRLAKTKPCFTAPIFYDNQYGSRIIFQLWYWAKNMNIYSLDHFIMKEREGKWETVCRKAVYRALLRNELDILLIKSGFTALSWLTPEESGFYQPVVVARKTLHETLQD